MKKYIVTVGTSLREARCWKQELTCGARPEKYSELYSDLWQGEPKLFAKVVERAKDEYRRLTEICPKPEASEIGRYLDADIWDRQHEGHLLSAEIATLQAMRFSKDKFFMTGDAIEFLYAGSNAYEGRCCAAIVEYLSTQAGTGMTGVSCRKCELQSDWDPRNAVQFEKSVAELSPRVREWVREGSSFVLTGAHKGILLRFGSWVGREFDPRNARGDGMIYYVYEGGQQLITFPIARLHNQQTRVG